MASKDNDDFLRSTFRSVWSLELLLFLRSHRGRAWTPAALVEEMRGSELLVTQSLKALLAAGLIDLGPDGSATYLPATDALDRQVEGAAARYARSPDAVRRAIIAGAASGGDLAAFADAFRWRKD
jgi:hypothetical protein